MDIAITLLALLVEATAGYPGCVGRAVGHPVMAIGAMIGWLDRRLNRAERGPHVRKAAGLAALLAIIGVWGGAGFGLERALLAVPFGFLAVAVLASTLIAQRSLHRHVADVADALDYEGLAGGRRAVAHIVGRDPDALDEAGVARAAIESLAENFSDGVVAPVFWLALAGLGGGAAYKAINTADSMIGHRTPRHEQFGWAAARLDDLVNLPASRLSALLIVAAAALGSRKRAADAWRAIRRDATRHRSPNAGWPEAAMAGALGLCLAGPRVYGGTTVDDAYMGDGRRDATADDIRAALALYRRADMVLAGLLAAVTVVAVWPG
jgi:adenosylcobinamide-phosphate synthase